MKFFRYFIALAFLATVPVANWLIGNVGSKCIPNGPCLIPVGFGLSAPSGVLVIGLALVLRDAVQEWFGWRWSVALILIGAVLSGFLASSTLALAAFSAFAISELLDFAVYSRLRKRNIYAAVAASGVVGAFIDSAVFLFLAFGSLDYLAGNVLGKTWMTLLALPVLYTLRPKTLFTHAN